MSFKPNWIRPLRRSNQPNLDLSSRRRTLQRYIVDPRIAGWQRDLASYVEVGDFLIAQGTLAEALKSYRDALAIADRLTKVDPENAGWQHDLSLSYSKVGDVLMTQGNFAEAQKSYQDSLAVADRLAKVAPQNAYLQRDLAISQGRVANVLAKQGDVQLGA